MDLFYSFYKKKNHYQFGVFYGDRACANDGYCNKNVILSFIYDININPIKKKINGSINVMNRVYVESGVKTVFILVELTYHRLE